MGDLQIDLYSTFDEPYPFRGENSQEPLMIYPVLVKDFFVFHYLVQVLLVDKNSIPDAKIIQMPYLEYLIKYDSEKNNYMAFLGLLLSVVLRNKEIEFKYGYAENGKPVVSINGTVYNHKEFEKIKMVICEQNSLELPDERIAKEIRDKMREAEEIRMKMNGTKMAPLEDQLVAVSISTGLSLEDIYNTTIRKFKKMMERIDHKLHYEIYLSASMSGFVKFKDKNAIKHWLADLKKDAMGGMIAYEEFEQKFSSDSIAK